MLESQDLPSPNVRGFLGGAQEYEYRTEVPAAAKDAPRPTSPRAGRRGYGARA